MRQKLSIQGYFSHLFALKIKRRFFIGAKLKDKLTNLVFEKSSSLVELSSQN